VAFTSVAGIGFIIATCAKPSKIKRNLTIPVSYEK
jgi:hypothetical protein